MDKIWVFTENYLKSCSKMKPLDVLNYLEDYKKTLKFELEKYDFKENEKIKSILISIKIPEDLLAEFKATCIKKGLKYQTQIKALMINWLKENID